MPIKAKSLKSVMHEFAKSSKSKRGLTVQYHLLTQERHASTQCSSEVYGQRRNQTPTNPYPFLLLSSSHALFLIDPKNRHS